MKTLQCMHAWLGFKATTVSTFAFPDCISCSALLAFNPGASSTCCLVPVGSTGLKPCSNKAVSEQSHCSSMIRQFCLLSHVVLQTQLSEQDMHSNGCLKPLHRAEARNLVCTACWGDLNRNSNILSSRLPTLIRTCCK